LNFIWIWNGVRKNKIQRESDKQNTNLNYDSLSSHHRPSRYTT
jgi:hypothetical protein